MLSFETDHVTKVRSNGTFDPGFCNGAVCVMIGQMVFDGAGDIWFVRSNGEYGQFDL